MDTTKSFPFFCYLLTFYFSAAYPCENLDTLSSIGVAFRHGDRTPQTFEFYPNDPYINYPMEPMGHGALTNQGKEREYQTGQKLRERYNDFLGDNYRSQDISVISTNFDRTKESLSLVLAGLYPAKSEQVWKNDSDWQPIPINSIPYILDGLISAFSCPTFQRELATVKASKEYQADFSRFDELRENLTSLIGRNISNSRTMYDVYTALTAEKAMGLELPKWTELYFPNGPLKNAALFELQGRVFTPKLKKLCGGVPLRKILNDILFNTKSRSRKVHLYSVHDNTIHALLETMNLVVNEIPNYGSAIVFELHKCDGKSYLKIVYYKSIPPIFETRIIPGCSEYCPLEDFLDILKDVIPDDAIESCFGPSSNSLLIPESENPVKWFYRKLKEWYNV